MIKKRLTICWEQKCWVAQVPRFFCDSRSQEYVTTPWCDTWQMMPKGFDLSRFSRSNTPKIYPIPLYWLITRAFRTAFFDQSTQLFVLRLFWVKWSKWQYLSKLQTEKMSSTQNRKQKKWKTPKCPCISNTVIHCNSSNSSLYPYNVHICSLHIWLIWPFQETSAQSLRPWTTDWTALSSWLSNNLR